MRSCHFTSFLLAACLLGPNAVRAQTASPAKPAATPPHTLNSITPSDANYHAHADWTKECEDRVAAMKGKPCDIIFIGDSITQNFVEEPKGGWTLVGKSVWDKHYANRNALDFGVGADATQHVLYRLDHMDIKAFKPKVAVILIGVNNGQDSVADEATGIKAVVNKTRAIFPAAKIILLSVLPNGPSTKPLAAGPQKSLDVNKIIQTYADGQKVFYFDLNAKMVPVGNGWKGIGFDSLHVTQEGYELWATSMEPLLNQLLTSPF